MCEGVGVRCAYAGIWVWVRAYVRACVCVRACNICVCVSLHASECSVGGMLD